MKILKSLGWLTIAGGFAYMCLCGGNGLAVLVYTIALIGAGCWLLDFAEDFEKRREL